MAIKKKDKYLITVQGYDHNYTSPDVTLTVTITTKDPVKWFLSKPKLYFRFDFVPHVLLGFWKIK